MTTPIVGLRNIGRRLRELEEAIVTQRKLIADEYRRWLPRVQALRVSRDAYGDARALYDTVAAASYEADRARFDVSADAESEDVPAGARRSVQSVARAVGQAAKYSKTPSETIGREIDQFTRTAEQHIRMSVRR